MYGWLCKRKKWLHVYLIWSISERPKICSLAMYKIRKRIVRARKEPILDLILLAVKKLRKILCSGWFVVFICALDYSIINMEPASAMSSSLYIWEFVNTLNALIYIYQITYFSYVIMEIYNYKSVDWTDSQNIVFLSLAYKEYSIPVLIEILSPR